MTGENVLASDVQSGSPYTCNISDITMAYKSTGLADEISTRTFHSCYNGLTE